MESGRIVFYNSEKGEGRLTLNSKENIDFTIGMLEDFSSAPEAGDMVSCIMENGVLKSIKCLQQSDSQENPASKVSDALENYFSSINSLVGEQNELIDSTKQLDYFLSRRFLMTAYNNLRNFDPAIHDHKDITEKLELIKQLHKAYYNAGEKVNVPELAFEMIFLRSQPEYLQYISDKQRCTDRITVLAIMEKSLLPQIQDREAEVKKLSKSDKRRKILEDKIKPLRGSYVDAVDEKASLAEELSALTDIKAIYTEKYFDAFVDALSKLSGKYQKVLSTILNHKAYELDELIWQNAAKSKLIQGYFCDAGIEGDYSTKTYLRYYLNSLDKKQLGDKQGQLIKFLNYLEKTEK